MKSPLLSFIIILSLVTFTFASDHGLDDNKAQVTTIISLCKILEQERPPTVADFFSVFGKDNKAELELLLRNRFPFVDYKRDWSKNRKVLAYVNEVYNEPIEFRSLFLGCMKIVEPKVFTSGMRCEVSFPPVVINDLKKYTVIIGNQKVIFEYSQEESYIENIYLPSGESIYAAVERCQRK
jgi:hypothetical protein